MRHAFDRSDAPPLTRRKTPPLDRLMALLSGIVLMPYTWLLLTRVNFECATEALRHARGRDGPPRDLPVPLLGSLAGLLMALYVGWAMPGDSAVGLLALPWLWPGILLPDLAWLVPAVAARLVRRL